jgi:hypothetical protein
VRRDPWEPSGRLLRDFPCVQDERPYRSKIIKIQDGDHPLQVCFLATSPPVNPLYFPSFPLSFPFHPLLLLSQSPLFPILSAPFPPFPPFSQVFPSLVETRRSGICALRQVGSKVGSLGTLFKSLRIPEKGDRRTKRRSEVLGG